MLLIACAMPVCAQTQVFNNNVPLTISDSAAPPTKASVYPSQLYVSGMTNPTSVTVRLNGFYHRQPVDLDIVLVSPTGRAVKIMSDVGGTSQVSNVSITIADTASSPISQFSLFSGTYRVSDVLISPNSTDPMPSPAPNAGYGTSMAFFNGFNPNGWWSIYIADDTTGGTGTNSMTGWTLTLSGPPANDDLANAEVIASALTSGTTFAGTSEIGETRGVPVSPRRSVWYDWTAPATGEYVIETTNVAYDTTLDVYTGTAYPLTRVAFNDDAPDQSVAQSGLILSVTSGTVYHIQVDAYFASGVGPFDLRISNPVTPVITSATTAGGTLGVPATYAIRANNYPTSFSATGVPPGMTLNPTTGVITGAPTSAGTFAMVVGAINSAGTDTQTVTVTVTNPPPGITSAQTAAATIGVPFTYDIVATGAPTSFGAAPLPTWLTVDTATGRLSGTPTAAGVASVALSATNSGGTGTGIVTITISGPTSSSTRFINTTSDASGCGFGSAAAMLVGALLWWRRMRV
ncbi:MAG: putative Ig domain-containing protein [Planctomycetes bacterium]|nr:putative Ig domain-containing protein [Planctomycetota bacterium]